VPANSLTEAGEVGEEMAHGLMEGTDLNVLCDSDVILREGADVWNLLFP